MTIKEFKKILEKYPEDANVVFSFTGGYDDFGEFDGHGIFEIRMGEFKAGTKVAELTLDEDGNIEGPRLYKITEICIDEWGDDPKEYAIMEQIKEEGKA